MEGDKINFQGKVLTMKEIEETLENKRQERERIKRIRNKNMGYNRKIIYIGAKPNE